jgi:hypothetical protein
LDFPRFAVVGHSIALLYLLSGLVEERQFDFTSTSTPTLSARRF